MSQERFGEVFEILREVMRAHEASLVVVHDEAGNYHLNTSHVMPNKKPMYFGAVQIRKNYVSYHLMPVYVAPGLLKGMSPDLRKRMQGKSCFNFREVDQPLFRELAELTAAGYRSYKSAGYA